MGRLEVAVAAEHIHSLVELREAVAAGIQRTGAQGPGMLAVSEARKVELSIRTVAAGTDAVAAEVEQTAEDLAVRRERPAQVESVQGRFARAAARSEAGADAEAGPVLTPAVAPAGTWEWAGLVVPPWTRRPRCYSRLLKEPAALSAAARQLAQAVAEGHEVQLVTEGVRHWTTRDYHWPAEAVFLAEIRGHRRAEAGNPQECRVVY